MAKRDVRAKGWVPGLGAMMALLPLYGVLEADSSFEVAISMLFFSYLLAECWFGPALSIIQSRVEQESRAFAISIYLFLGSMVGNVSPLIISNLDDGVSDSKLGSLLFACVVFSYVSCTVFFVIASFGLGNAPMVLPEDETLLGPPAALGGYQTVNEQAELEQEEVNEN